MEEVRFERMVPAMVLARRKKCNLAYLPVGALEWHGSHMPFGTDYFSVTYIAEEAARRFGGVAFPPIYYGDVRYNLHDCRAEWRKTYTQQMEVPQAYASSFPHQNADGSPGSERPTQPDDGTPASDPLEFSRVEQGKFFVHLIAKTLLSIHLYGFCNIVILPGHGPNLSFCRQVEEVYRQNVLRRTAFGSPAKTLTWFYIEAGKEIEPLLKNHWIHADKWEGSVTVVTAPGTVRLDLLPKDPKTLVPAYLGHPYLTETDGYNPAYKDIWYSFDALDPRNGTSEEYGKAQIEGILSKFGEVISEFMKEPSEIWP